MTWIESFSLQYVWYERLCQTRFPHSTRSPRSPEVSPSKAAPRRTGPIRANQSDQIGHCLYELCANVQCFSHVLQSCGVYHTGVYSRAYCRAFLRGRGGGVCSWRVTSFVLSGKLLKIVILSVLKLKRCIAYIGLYMCIVGGGVGVGGWMFSALSIVPLYYRRVV